MQTQPNKYEWFNPFETESPPQAQTQPAAKPVRRRLEPRAFYRPLVEAAVVILVGSVSSNAIISLHRAVGLHTATNLLLHGIEVGIGYSLLYSYSQHRSSTYQTGIQAAFNLGLLIGVFAGWQ